MDERRLTRKEKMALTASAIRKVHQRGQRGVEMVTHDEIVALVGTVLEFGRDALEQETRKETTQ